MPKRTPDATVQRFERRPGGEFPALGGMSRLGDTIQIPPNKHHLLVNTRFHPGELASRPGLVEDSNIGFEACITGLIETQQNNGFGGVVSGLLIGYGYGNGPEGSRHWYYLNPEQENVPVDSEARALITQNPAVGSVFIPESYSPLCGVRAHWWSVRGCGPSALLTGPNHPFEFQGSICMLGQTGSPAYQMGVYAIEAPDDEGPGALNRLTNFGQYYPHASCVRKEIVGGDVIEVLYFVNNFDAHIYRFDGTTLSLWYPAGTFYPTHLFRPYCEGQEILLLGSSTLATNVTGSPLPPDTGDFANGVILYQQFPGGPISPCSINANMWSQPLGQTSNRLIGFTGAARYRDNWYVFVDSSPGAMHSGQVAMYGQVLAAPVGPRNLAFVEVYTPGFPNIGDYTDPAKFDYGVWMGYPTVFKDQLFFFSLACLYPTANGSCITGVSGTAPNPTNYHVGRFDGSVWDEFHLSLPAGPGENHDGGTANWMAANGDQLIIAFWDGSFTGDEHIWFYRSPTGIEKYTVSGNAPVVIPGTTIGTHSRIYAVPDEDDLAEEEA